MKNKIHCVKSVQIGNFFRSLFSRIWTEYRVNGVNLRVHSEYGKCGPEKTRYLDTFHAVIILYHNLLLPPTQEHIQYVIMAA